MNAKKYTVRKTGRTWSIYFNGKQLIEGGFFGRDAAEDSCAAYNAEWNINAREAQAEYDDRHGSLDLAALGSYGM